MAKTKYKPEYCQAIIDFFTIDPTREVPVVTKFKNGTVRESSEERPNPLRFFADFAISIGVTDATVVNWAKKHDDFLSAYTRAKALQKAHLITCGLLGLFNSKFAVFTACNITDMSDKQELRADFKQIPATVEELEKQLAEMKAMAKEAESVDDGLCDG